MECGRPESWWSALKWKWKLRGVKPMKDGPPEGYVAWINEQVLQEMRPRNVMRPFSRGPDGGNV